MSCPGLHCPGCVDVSAGLAVAVPVAIGAWLICANLVFVIVVLLASTIVSSAVVGWLIRAQDRRELLAVAEWRDQHQPAVFPASRAGLPRSERHAVGGGVHYHLHLPEGIPAEQQAAILRQAISR